MTDLIKRLRDVNEAGAYELNCTLDELSEAVKKAGLMLFDVDLVSEHGKGEFLAVVAQAIHAPGWFGNNWDALADALSDLSWNPAPGYVLLLRNGDETLGMSETDHATAIDIIDAANEYWKAQGKPFWVFRC